jgi:oligoendopeptidase F
MTTTPLRKRSEIPVEHTWDTASIFPDLAAWEAEIKAIDDDLAQVDAFKGHLGDSPARLADFLELSDALSLRLGKIFVYVSLNSSVDTTDQAWQARNGQAMGFFARARARMSFYKPEALRIGFDTIKRWTNEEPRLALYAHHFDLLEREAAHVRSDEVEELLSQMGDAFQSARRIHGILTDADLRYPPATDSAGATVELALGSMQTALQSPDRELRKSAWRSDRDAHLAAKNTMAACLTTGVKQDVFMMRARKYGSSLEAALAPNTIPVEVFHNLIAVFKKNLPTWHRYFEARRKLLGVDTLQPWDIVAPLTSAPPEVPYAKSVEWICEGMAPLGREYVDVARAGMTSERWVDIYPNAGKRQGAFSSGLKGTKPFIMMSYNDTLFAMSTLAHELGHSMHSWYSRRAQPGIYAGYSLFVAEVASTLNENLLLHRMLATTKDPKTRLFLLSTHLEGLRTTMFRQTLFAEFELAIHEKAEKGEALSGRAMSELYLGLVRFFRNFYVYQYATSIIASSAIANGIYADLAKGANKPMPHRDAYLRMLSSGSSKFPIDLLKDAGVDMTTSAPFRAAMAEMNATMDEMERILAEQPAEEGSGGEAGS